jgi:preprotein translocase subunit SecG
MLILINILLALWMLVALLMVFVILMQRPKSEGLGAAFGGAVTENIFGAQTTNVLVKFTGWLAGIFFALTFVLSILYANKNAGDSALRRELMKTQATSPASPLPAGQASPVGSVAPAGSAAAAGSPPASGAAVGIVPPASAPLTAPSASPSGTASPQTSP